MGKCKTNSTAQTAAERQARRRARIAADPALLAETRAKERLRWHQRVRTGKVKLVADLSDRQKRLKRREWRSRWKDRAAKQKTVNSHCEIPRLRRRLGGCRPAGNMQVVAKKSGATEVQHIGR